MLEQPAQAIGCADDRGIAGRGGFSLDVVRGPKPFGMGLFGQALAHQFLSRRFEALAFGLHPLREFGGQQRQRRLGTRHRIVIFRGRLRDRLVQRVRRRNDFVVGERRDSRMSVVKWFGTI
jgi:hypothetical protein